MNICSGVHTALITPFDAKGEIDKEGLHFHLQRQQAAEVDGLVILGTTSEALALSHQEKIDVIKWVRQKWKLPLMVGCGSYSIQEAIANIEQAAHLGADSALVITPYYCKPTQEGIIRYYETLCKMSPIPILLYNNPSRAAISMTTETVERLAQHPKVIGIKESSGSVVQCCDLIASIKKMRPSFSLLAGDDNLFFPIMAIGGDGVISGGANLIPKWMSLIYRLCKNGKWEEARKNHLKLVPLLKALIVETHPIPLKEALHLCQLPSGQPRPPLTPLNPKYFDQLKSAIDEILRE